MESDAFLPSEIARLVLGYLQETGCQKSSQLFLKECIHLREYNTQLQKGIIYPTSIGGRRLNEMLQEYGQKVIETQKAQQSQKVLWRKLETVLQQLKKYQNHPNKPIGTGKKSSTKAKYLNSSVRGPSTPLCRNSTIDSVFDLTIPDHTDNDEDTDAEGGGSSPGRSSVASEPVLVQPRGSAAGPQQNERYDVGRYVAGCSDSGISTSRRSGSSLQSSSPSLLSTDVSPYMDSTPPDPHKMDYRLLNPLNAHPHMSGLSRPPPVTKRKRGRPPKNSMMPPQVLTPVTIPMLGGSGPITVLKVPHSGLDLPQILHSMNTLGTAPQDIRYSTGHADLRNIVSAGSTETNHPTVERQTHNPQSSLVVQQKIMHKIHQEDQKCRTEHDENTSCDEAVTQMMSNLPDLDDIDSSMTNMEDTQSTTGRSVPHCTEKKKSFLLSGSVEPSSPLTRAENDADNPPSPGPSTDRFVDCVKTPIKNFLNQNVRDTMRNVSPRRKSQAPRRRSSGVDVPARVRTSPAPSEQPANSNSNDSFVSQGSQGFVPLIEGLINNSQFAHTLAASINKVKKNQPKAEGEETSNGMADNSDGPKVNEEMAVTSEGLQTTTDNKTRTRKDSVDRITSEELDQLFMEEDTINNIIDMTRSDPHFDTLFQMFNVDKNAFIEKEYGVLPPTTSHTEAPPLSFGNILQSNVEDTLAPQISHGGFINSDVPTFSVAPSTSVTISLTPATDDVCSQSSVAADNQPSFVDIVYPSDDGQGSHVETVQIITVTKESEMEALQQPVEPISEVKDLSIVENLREDVDRMEQQKSPTTNATAGFASTSAGEDSQNGPPDHSQLGDLVNKLEALNPMLSPLVVSQVLMLMMGKKSEDELCGLSVLQNLLKTEGDSPVMQALSELKSTSLDAMSTISLKAMEQLVTLLSSKAKPVTGESVTESVESIEPEAEEDSAADANSVKSTPPKPQTRGKKKASKKAPAGKNGKDKASGRSTPARSRTPCSEASLDGPPLSDSEACKDIVMEDEEEEERKISKRSKKVGLCTIGKTKKTKSEPWKINPKVDRRKYLGMSWKNGSDPSNPGPANTGQSASLLIDPCDNFDVKQCSVFVAEVKASPSTPKSTVKPKKTTKMQKQSAAQSKQGSTAEEDDRDISSPPKQPDGVPEFASTIDISCLPLCSVTAEMNTGTTLKASTDHKQEKHAKEFLLTSPRVNQAVVTPSPKAVETPSSTKHIRSLDFGQTKDKLNTRKKPAVKATQSSGEILSMPATLEFNSDSQPSTSAKSVAQKAKSSTKKDGAAPSKASKKSPKVPAPLIIRTDGPRTRSQTAATPRKEDKKPVTADATTDIIPDPHSTVDAEDKEVAETLITLATKAIVTPRKRTPEPPACGEVSSAEVVPQEPALTSQEESIVHESSVEEGHDTNLSRQSSLDRSVTATTSAIIGSPAAVTGQIRRVACKPAAMAAWESQLEQDTATQDTNKHKENTDSKVTVGNAESGAIETVREMLVDGSADKQGQDCQIVSQTDKSSSETTQTPVRCNRIPNPLQFSPKRTSSLKKLVEQSMKSLGLESSRFKSKTKVKQSCASQKSTVSVTQPAQKGNQGVISVRLTPVKQPPGTVTMPVSFVRSPHKISSPVKLSRHIPATDTILTQRAPSSNEITPLKESPLTTRPTTEKQTCSNIIPVTTVAGCGQQVVLSSGDRVTDKVIHRKASRKRQLSVESAADKTTPKPKVKKSKKNDLTPLGALPKLDGMDIDKLLSKMHK